MEVYIICALAAFSAVLMYLRATAAKTATQVDDKILAALEKVEPVVEAVKPKASSPK